MTNWYAVNTGINAKDMFGAVAYIESKQDLEALDKEEAHTIISELYPDLSSGQYIKDISKLDWELNSEEYNSKEEFMRELGKVVGSYSNAAYCLGFDGRCSVKDARKL